MDAISYPLNEVALVVKRHTHEVRNALNGMELELTLLEEGAVDPAVREAVKQLRGAGAEIGRLLQGLSSKYGPEAPCNVPVIQLAERWAADARHCPADASLQWNIRLGDEVVCVETGLVRTLLRDELEMALRVSGQRSLQINCCCQQERALFEITAEEGVAGVGIIDSQQAYWAALRRLAERTDGLMNPAKLSPTGSFPMQLSFPLHRVAS